MIAKESEHWVAALILRNENFHLCDMKALNEFYQNGLPGSMTYDAYVNLISNLLEEEKTTGPNQSDLYVNFTKLNYTRMNRVKKTFSPAQPLLDLVKAQKNQTWLVISEAWCGDAAQSVPMMANLAEKNPEIKLQIILRDEHPEIMDLFLTDGGKGIPVLIVLNETGKVLFHWGPRPEPAQQMVRDYKALPDPKPDYLKFAESVQSWYAADRGKTFSQEIADHLLTVNME